MRALAVVVVLALLPLAAACAGGGDARPEFKFTPYPYTVVPDTEHESAGDVETVDGELFQADQVYAEVTDRDAFLARIASLEFAQYGHDYPVDDEATGMYVTVPLGSAQDAAELLRDDPNVKRVTLSYIATIGD